MSHLWVVILSIVVGCFSIEAWAQTTYNWSLVRKGGKEVNNTLATGINDSEWMAGNWSGHRDPSDPGGAFRYQKGKFVPFAVPGATETFVADIESSSTIVGYYTMPDGAESVSIHAYLYKHGLNAFDQIDVPVEGAIWTFPYRVNAKRQVALGYFHWNGEGVDWRAGIYDWATKGFTDITLDRNAEVLITGLNNHGELVGSFTERNEADPCTCRTFDRAFYRNEAGEAVELASPTGELLSPQAINDNGIVVGRLGDRGFRWDLNTGAFEEIEHAVRNEASGWLGFVTDINNKGQLTFVTQRQADGYTETSWLRPIAPKVAKK